MKLLLGLWLVGSTLLAATLDPQVMSWVDDESLVVADSASRSICRVTRQGRVEVLRRFAGEGETGESPSPAPVLEFEEICGLAPAPDRALYVIGDSAVWLLDKRGELRILAGDPDGDSEDGVRDGTAGWARFDDVRPDAAAAGADGCLYLLEDDCLRRVSPAGQVRTLVALPTEWKAVTPGTPGRQPVWSMLAVDGQGNSYVLDGKLGVILKVGREGSFVELPRPPVAGERGLLAAGPAGELAVVDPDQRRGCHYDPATGWRSLPIELPGSPGCLRFDGRGRVLLGTWLAAAEPGVALHRLAVGAAVPSDGDEAPAAGGWVRAGRGRVALVRSFPSAEDRLPPGVMWRKPAASPEPPGSRSGLAVDGQGTVYVADAASRSLVRISSDGQVRTWPGLLPGSGPTGVIASPSGSVFFAGQPGEEPFRELLSDGTLLTGGESWRGLKTLAAGWTDPDGTMWLSDGSTLLLQVRADGYLLRSWPLQESRRGPAVDSLGNGFVADWQNHILRRIAPDGTSVILAGQAGEAGCADGPGGEARFDTPTTLALGPAGALYVLDQGGSAVRRVDAGGQVTTLFRGAAESPSEAMAHLLERVASAVIRYRERVGRLPDALTPGSPLSLFLRRADDLVDIWGARLRLRTDAGEGTARLESAGPDGQFDTADDLVHPLPQ